ncbi:MAG: hypothetical protein JXB39_05940 [Deltaproteobacteria bacterium]|nr:hypothetical protein [Deltaproteobacteria bacterium]
MILLALLAGLSSPSLAEDEAAREDDLFGAADPTGARVTDDAIASNLGRADQRLTVGGRIYLRANAYVPEDPELDEVRLDSPSLLDLYADARPNDRLRGFAQGRVRHDPTVSEGDVDWMGVPRDPATVALDQMWINLDLGGRVFVTAGQQRIKWGVGRFWNPTDFLDPARLDALAFFDERTGVPLLKVHAPFGEAGLNLYGFAGFESAHSLDQVQGAVRIEWLLGLTEIALSSAVRKGDPERFGGQVNTALGPLDVKAEVAVTHGLATPGWRGTFDWEATEVPSEVDRSDDWIPQAVAGVEWGVRYSDQDSLYVGAEAFFNDLGTDDPDLYAWLALQGQFTPFYLGRYYGGAYLFLPSPGRWDDHTFVLSTLGNLSDRSFVSRVDWSAFVVTELSVNAYAQVHYGAFGEFRYALEVPPIAGVLPEGLSVSSPLVDAGFGMAVRF